MNSLSLRKDVRCPVCVNSAVSLRAVLFPCYQRSYVFTFLLSSRLFLHPYELMTRVCHLCVEQQRSGDALLDKVGGLHTLTHTRRGRFVSLRFSFSPTHIYNVFQIRFREVAPKLVQLLTEWTETFPYDFRDERMMRCLKDMTHHVARGEEVSTTQYLLHLHVITIQIKNTGVNV